MNLYVPEKRPWIAANRKGCCLGIVLFLIFWIVMISIMEYNAEDYDFYAYD